MNAWYQRRRWMYGGLVLLFVLDALVYAAWLRQPRSDPAGDQAAITALAEEVATCAAEVSRLERVRHQAPRLRPDLKKFVEERVLAERTGSSRIASELEEAASAVGVKLSQVKYNPEVDKQQPDLTRMVITTSIEGGYGNLLRFLAALERSPHFYLVNDLAVGSMRGGQIRIEMKLVTYLRRGAA